MDTPVSCENTNNDALCFFVRYNGAKLDCLYFSMKILCYNTDISTREQLMCFHLSYIYISNIWECQSTSVAHSQAAAPLQDRQ